ncbi:MarP family serine protease [Agromyces marinus]|uniref:Serine protease n=1 Tax=Agromyces marinus TaxID=1389020 RepID=A0ABN6YEP8_9MICO|nr:MarP family serine protease [Agromyces marinus]UIP59316.1 Serine protease [Agromyces marinus]BDZ55663.1 serine protease [Agromyces marinus]
MTWSLLLDIALAVVLIGALVRGWRSGLLRTLGGLLGLVAGGIAAYFAMPWVVSLIPVSQLRAPLAIATAVALLIAGASIGGAVGRALGRGAEAVKLGILDRILGAVVNAMVTAFVVALVAAGVGSMGVPVVSPAVAGSWVVRSIDGVTPSPARTLMAELRSAAVGGAIPWLTDVLGGPTVAPELPAGGVDDPEVRAAAASVVRVTGLAFECGGNLTGTGFVVAPDRIVTNAHVVAGVVEPIVEAPGHGPVSGRVVAFDPDVDLAVIAADGLDVEPLAVSDAPGAGTDVAVAGYPFGGPLELRPAEVMANGPLTISIDGASSSRDVVTLAADIDHGNSGGPVLTGDGEVGGVVFAKSQTVDNVGFAVPVGTLRPLAEAAPTLGDAVDSGRCSF